MDNPLNHCLYAQLLLERELHQVLCRYARACDTRDWAAMDEVFTADAHAHYGSWHCPDRAALVGMVALDCLGLAGEEGHPNWIPAAAVFLVFKDLAAFFSTGGQGVAREPPGHWKEGLADFLLLAFGCVAYTVWWQGLFDLGDLATQSVGMKIALAILLGGMFLFFYLPMRVPFVLDECYRQPALGRRRRIWSELAIGAALGFYPAFF